MPTTRPRRRIFANVPLNEDPELKSRRIKKVAVEPALLRPLEGEQLLIDLLPELEGANFLCVSPGRGQFAAAAAERFPQAAVTLHYLDLFAQHQAELALRETAPRVNVVCSADFPDGEFDVCAIPITKKGDAELTRDLLQMGAQRLQQGGRFIAATRQPDDQWLHAELRRLFPKVTRRPLAQGTVYLATKTNPIKKIKDFSCEFAFRDEGRLVRVVSRPGVFSHRKLDGGARSLLRSLVVQPGQRILDMGCGSGAVGLAAALRQPGVTLLAVDSHARALDCTLKGAALNKIHTLTTRLADDGNCGEKRTCQVCVGNPPYYSDHQIAELFLQAAQQALQPRGTVLMVTKSPEWFVHRMGELFVDVDTVAYESYHIVTAKQPR